MRAAILCLSVLTAVAAAGDLCPPLQVGAGILAPEGARMAVDGASNAFLVFHGRGDAAARMQVFCGISLDGFAALQRISVEGCDCRDPAIAIGQLGVIHLVFEARSADGAVLYYITNKGGPFQAPQRLTSAAGVSESSGSIWVDAAGGIRVVWEESDGAASRVMYAIRGEPAAVLAENASRPRAYLSPQSARLHVLFLRDGGLFYVREGSLPALLADGIAADAGYDVVTATVNDVPHIVFTTELGVWHTTLAGSAFCVPVLVASGGSVPCIRRLPDDAVACTYVRQGDVYRRVNRAAVFDAEELLDATTAVETEATCAYDGAGFFHLAAAADGALWYRNDIPAPEAAFSRDPAFGEAPLAVKFTDESTGPIRSRLWEFGDGSTSIERDPTHLYAAPGKYTVTLTVIGPGGSAQTVQPSCVEVAASRNRLSIPDIKVWPGEGLVRHPVLAEHPEPIQGGQIAVAFRDEYLTGLHASIAGTSLETLKPEFVAESITDGADGEKQLVFGIIIDVDPPFDGRVLPAAPRAKALLYLEYGVAFGAPLGVRTPLELRNGLGSPPIDNVFTIVGAVSVWPALAGGSATTAPRPACLFKRGDGNFDRAVDLADAIFTLSYLFGRATTPSCLDASDANDSASVDIGDAIYILTYLFAGGSMPAYPFPDYGIDPSDDGLGECVCPPR